MKQMKKVLYLLGILMGMTAMIFVFTAVTQLGMQMIASKFGFALAEDMLYYISGNCGTGLTAILYAVYVKKKKYCQCKEPAEAFHVGKAFFYMVLSVCVCNILLSGVTTMLLAQVLPMTDMRVSELASNYYVDIIFITMVAPVIEELLFRMGIYSMLRRKFSRVSSLVVCAFVFAVMHGYQLQGFLSCLLAGFVFTLIYDKSGKIGYSIAAHMACNISSTITNALEDAGVTWLGLPVQYEINGYNMYHVGLIIVAVVFCGVSIVVYNKKKSVETVVQTN